MRSNGLRDKTDTVVAVTHDLAQFDALAPRLVWEKRDLSDAGPTPAYPYPQE